MEEVTPQELEKFDTLLKEFKDLPPAPKPPRRGILELLGGEDKETLYTQLLAFLLDPSAEHGWKDMVLLALIEALPMDEGKRDLWTRRVEGSARGGKKYSVQPETGIEKGQIDLLIESHKKDSEKWCIGIENKLHSGEGWKQLQRYAESLRKDGVEFLGIYLNLREEKEDLGEDRGNFVAVKYESFLKEVKEQIGFVSETPRRHKLYLDEFIRGIERQSPLEDTHFEEFYLENKNVIDELVERTLNFDRDRKGLLWGIRRYLEEYHGVVYKGDRGRYPRWGFQSRGNNTGPWYEIKVSGQKLRIDFDIPPSLDKPAELLLYDNKDWEINSKVLRAISRRFSDWKKEFSENYESCYLLDEPFDAFAVSEEEAKKKLEEMADRMYEVAQVLEKLGKAKG